MLHHADDGKANNKTESRPRISHRCTRYVAVLPQNVGWSEQELSGMVEGTGGVRSGVGGGGTEGMFIVNIHTS